MGSTAPDPSDIAVTIEIASASDRLRVFSRVHALSERENEVLLNLAAGADTRTVAGTMSVSGHTVQDYLKAIFTKTDSHSRPTLLARALGQ
jgi:DNA-binding CsgD family transcriptional regulator